MCCSHTSSIFVILSWTYNKICKSHFVKQKPRFYLSKCCRFPEHISLQTEHRQMDDIVWQ